MSTANNIIKDALRKIGAIATGEALSSEMANDALRALNLMIDDWSTQNLLVLGKVIEEFSLVAGKYIYTIGSGGDFDTTIPIRTDLVFIKKSDNSEKTLKVIDNYMWGKINFKTNSASTPEFIYIDDNYPLKSVYLNPIPNEVSTIVFHNYRQFTEFSSLTTQVSLPKGHERALIYNLALELASEYGKNPSQEIYRIASQSLSGIKRVNISKRTVPVDMALLYNSNHSSRGFSNEV